MSVKVGDVVKDPALLRPGMRVRSPEVTGSRPAFDATLTEECGPCGMHGTGYWKHDNKDHCIWLIDADWYPVTVLALPDQPAAGEVKGSVTFEKGEWYEFNHNGIHYVGRATGVLTGGGEVELDAWKGDSMNFVRYAIGGLPVADCVGGPVPGPDEGKAADRIGVWKQDKKCEDCGGPVCRGDAVWCHECWAGHKTTPDGARCSCGDYVASKKPPPPPRCAPGCTPKEPCWTRDACPALREGIVSQMAMASMYAESRRADWAEAREWRARSVAAPMRTGLGGLACGMVNVEHGVRRRPKP